MKRMLGWILILCLTICAVAAAEEIDWRALEGGELAVYVGCDEKHGAAVVEAFREKTGIDVSYQRFSANDCYVRIRDERENPRADVWYGGTWDPFIAAAREGLLYAYEDFGHLPYKSVKYGIGEPYWFGIYSGYIGFICDMDALNAAGVPAPGSWEDLTKPEYAGMICMGNPNVTGDRRDDGVHPVPALRRGAGGGAAVRDRRECLHLRQHGHEGQRARGQR